VEGIEINFASDEVDNMSTGFQHMKELFPDSSKKLDQFIVRFLDLEETGTTKLTPERCVRLKNGFLSTEREAIDWERRNEKAKEAYMRNFLKENQLRLNKSAGKKTQPNAKCPCGSGKKHKKCCMSRKEVTGLVGDRKVEYKDR
jgi:hypothetical protein